LSLQNYVALGSRAVPAVDPLGPQDVQAGGEDHPQVHPYTEQNEGDRYKGRDRHGRYSL
jgi:hypothetical protein